jgi:CheY-like chemotaxis protein
MIREIKRILLVDDNRNDIELTLNVLEANNLVNEVIVAEDGTEALDYLFRRGKFASHEPGNPAVILLDIKMPKMNGIEVLKQIRADPKLKSIPVIMLTSSAEEKDVVESYNLGANSYVIKPVDINQFINAIKTLEQFWAVINQPPPKQMQLG